MGVIADKIRRAIFGGEVRESIADGIEVVEQLREDYDNQVINAGNSNAEIVDARGGQTKLKDRLDNFDEQLETITGYIYLKDYRSLVSENDWSTALETAIIDSINNNIPLFINNGEYGVTKTITPSIDIDSEIAMKVLTIIGESPHGVIFKGVNNFSDRVFDFRYMRNLYLENFTSNLNYHFIQYGADENKIQSKRSIVIKNVYCMAGGEQINWNNYICCPRPNNYNDNNDDGRYARYPLEIMDFGGYNSIMIVKKSVDENGNYVNGGVDSSAIGVTDMVQGVSTPVFLIDGGRRSFTQYKNRNAESVSGEREYVVYEVDQLGRIAIGCSCQSSDPNANGDGLIKARGKYPKILMYDHNRGNRKFETFMADDITYLRNYDESGNIKNEIAMNYKSGAIVFKGTVQLGNLLTWEGTDPVRNANGITSIYVPSIITSRFENVIGGVEGQTIHIISDGILTVEHNKDGWGNIRTNTKANVILEKGVIYTITRINNVWYLK